MKLPYKILGLILIVVIVSFAIFGRIFNKRNNNIQIERNSKYFGVTFSKKYANEIGLHWQEVYLAILDDLKVKNIRLPIYWDEIEPTKGVFDYSDYDFMFTEGAKRNVNFVVNVGWRLPRWPECHAPSWTNSESIESIQADTLKMLEKTVNRYKDNSAVKSWQIENEPFLNTFGICPPSDEAFFAKEVALIKSLDKRPVIVSGPGDIFGTTMYRVIWNPVVGYMKYPIPAWFYRAKAWFAGITPDKRIIIELQAEPWVPQGKIIYLSKNEAQYSFDVKQFKENIQYALDTKFNKSYLWGVEWWYWQYKHGDKSFWSFAKTLF